MSDSAAPAAEEMTAGDASLSATLLACVGNSRALVADMLDLATLEARLAALSLVEMLVFAVTVALLGFTIWALALAAIATALLAAGWSWPLALLALAVISAVALWLGIRRIRSLSDNLRFTATRQLLAPSRAEETDRAYPDPPPAR